MSVISFIDTETTPRRGRPPENWDGLCNQCGKPGRFYPRNHVCAKCQLENRTKRLAEPGPARERHLKLQRDWANENHRKRRLLVIMTYGGRCVCCKESELAFLTMDHIDEGGNAHRRTLTKDGSIAGSPKFYNWLIKNNFPSGFQVLCHNCNFAKSHGGCPHGNC